MPGWHAARAFLEARPASVERVLLVREAPEALVALAREAGVSIEQVETGVLDRLAGGVPHQGIVALGRAPEPVPLAELSPERDRVVLALDGLTDPRNVGATIRTAEAAGAGAVVLPRDRAPGLSPALVKAAAGAVEWLPLVRVVNLARSLADLGERGWWLVGLDGEGDLGIHDPRAIPGLPCVLVAGSEGSGIRHLTRQLCHRVVRIPMAGRVESLNASVAAAIGLFEIRRRIDASLV